MEAAFDSISHELQEEIEDKIFPYPYNKIARYIRLNIKVDLA